MTKINNFTNGGSDTKDGRVPSGSDTKPFYTTERDPKTMTYAKDRETESLDPRVTEDLQRDSE